MAFGAPAFVDFTPDPSGTGYNFKKPTGESVYAYGDEADRLARNIAATKPPDLRTASNAMMSTESDEPNRSVPDTGQPPIGAPAPPGPPEPVRQGTTVDAQGIPANLPPMAGAPAPAAPVAPQRPQLPISPVRYQPGVNPAAMAKNAVAVPVAESMTMQGGLQDPEERAKVKDLMEQQIQATKEQETVQTDILKQQKSMLETQALDAALKKQQAEREIAESEAHKAILRQEFGKRVAAAQQEIDNQSKREVDQFRMFRGKPGAQFAAILGGAIGGFASGFNKTGRNPFTDVMDRFMDNDIAAQRQEIQQGNQRANNDLARIKETYGMDLDDASSVLKLAYVKKAESEAERRAALIGTQEAAMNLASMRPKFLQMEADLHSQMQAKLLGQVQITKQSKMVQPTQGGFVGKTPEQLAKEAEAYARIAKAQYEYGHEGSAPPKAGVAGPGKLPARMASQEATNRSAQEDLVQYMKEDAGGIIAPKVHGVGTDARINLDAKADAIVGKIVAGSNGSVNESELQLFREGLTSPIESVRKATAKRLHQALQTADKYLEQQRGNVQGAATAEEEGPEK